MERTNEKSKRINQRIIYSRENRTGAKKAPVTGKGSYFIGERGLWDSESN